MATIINNGTPLASLLDERTIATLNLRFFKSEGYDLQRMFRKHKNLTQKSLKKQREYLFYTNCKVPQTLKEFKIHKVNTEGLSKRQAAKVRRETYALWLQWKTNYYELHELLREETVKDGNPNVRRKKSYLANKQRQ